MPPALPEHLFQSSLQPACFPADGEILILPQLQCKQLCETRLPASEDGSRAQIS
jgi:hypothetical protein